MAKATIKEIKHSEKFPQEKLVSGLSVMDGFRFGFGFFVAFLTGFLILGGFAYLFWFLIDYLK